MYNVASALKGLNEGNMDWLAQTNYHRAHCEALDIPNLPRFRRDLARGRPACILDRQFPENFLLGQATLSLKNSQF